MSFDFLGLRSLPYGDLRFGSSQSMHCYFIIIILFYRTLYTDCPDGGTDAVVHHVSFAQITCLCCLNFS